MKKPTLIAGAVLLALVLAVLATKLGTGERTGQPEGGYSVPALADLDKVEIVEGDKKTVLTRKDGLWRLAEPIDFPVDKTVAEDLDKIFVNGLGTDLGADDADPVAYDLGPGAPVVTVFAGGAQKAKFSVGKEIVVEATNAKRTWILPEGGGVFRAQDGLRSKLLIDLDKWRRKQITDFKEDDVTQVAMEYDGLKVVMQRKVGDKPEGSDKSIGVWTVTEPAGVEVDSQAVDRWVGAVGRLRIDKFADDAAPAAAGLDKPTATYTVTTGAGDVVLHIGGDAPVEAAADDKKPGEPDTYLSLGGEKWIYQAKAWGARSVFKKLGDIRPKEVLTLDKEKIVKLRFRPAGDAEPIELVKADKGWQVLGREAEAVDASIVDALVRTVTGLRATKLAESNQTAAQVGLAPDTREELVIGMQGEESTVLHLGSRAEGKDDRWAQVGEGQIFLLAGFNANKLTPKMDTIIRKPGDAPASAPGGNGLPPGFPGGMKGLPPGMQGLPPGMQGLPPGMQGAPPKR